MIAAFIVFVVLLCLGALVLGPIYRNAHRDNEIYFMYAWQACFDAIALGCLPTLLAQHLQPRARYAGALRWVAGAVLLLVYVRGIDGHEVLGFISIALVSSAFLFSAAKDVRSGFGTGRRGGWIRWFGRHSHELYLFHIVVLALMRNVASKEQLSYALRLPWLLLFLVLSALVAALVARYVSAPVNAALRRRFQLPCCQPGKRGGCCN